jgi:hypothetical protein
MIIEVGCMAHARDKFKDAESTDPERMLSAKAWVRKLYEVEDEAKAIHRRGEVDRRRRRAPQAASGEGAATIDITTSMAGDAEGAGAAQEPRRHGHQLHAKSVGGPQRYTTDGDLHIDNNLSERPLKLSGMGRIN